MREATIVATYARAFIDKFYRTHIGKIKTHQLASLGCNDQCVSD